MSSMEIVNIEDMDISPAISFEVMKANVRYSSTRGIKKITDNPAWRAENNIAIVGGGPSLTKNLDKLRNYKYIMACGSVHDYLVENKIYPNWCVICDSDEIMLKYLKHKNLVTEYLIASQCHPKLINYFAHHPKTYLWHASGSDEENDLIDFPKEDYKIGGGCTVGTRAIVMAIMFGFKRQHLFGFDSCLDGDKHHAYDYQDPVKETLGEISEIKVGSEDSPTFKVAGYMLAQIKEFQIICKLYNDINFIIESDGPIKAIVDKAHKDYNERVI